MAARYSVTELNTAIKPFVFMALFDRYPGEAVLYLDPDMHVTSRFDELFELVNGGAECVLTPSITEPAEHAEFDDRQFLRYGAYNLGFCCLVDSPGVRRVAWWWARRLETMCLVDLEAGLFVDQKWADLFPAFIERTSILRHPGVQRRLLESSQCRVREDDGAWSVNGLPLRMFHFSGNQIEDEFGPAPQLPPRRAQRGLGGATAGHLPRGSDGARPPPLHGYPLRLQLDRGPRGEPAHPRFRAGPTADGAGRGNRYLPVLAWRSRSAHDAWSSLSADLLAARCAAEREDIPHEDPFRCLATASSAADHAASGLEPVLARHASGRPVHTQLA